MSNYQKTAGWRFKSDAIIGLNSEKRIDDKPHAGRKDGDSDGDNGINNPLFSCCNLFFFSAALKISEGGQDEENTGEDIENGREIACNIGDELYEIRYRIDIRGMSHGNQIKDVHLIGF